MNSVYLTRIVQFCKQHNGTLILDYSHDTWDVLITWGDNKAYGQATDFTRALRIAWRKVAA